MNANLKSRHEHHTAQLSAVPMVSIETLDEIGEDMKFFYLNDVKKKKCHWAYTQVKLLGMRDSQLWFTFPDGVSRPIPDFENVYTPKY